MSSGGHKFNSPRAVAVFEQIDEATDDTPRRVVIRKQWEPNLRRDPLVCCLFGAPAAMAGVA